MSIVGTTVFVITRTEGDYDLVGTVYSSMVPLLAVMADEFELSGLPEDEYQDFIDNNFEFDEVTIR